MQQDPNKKYFKRGELLAKEQEEYFKKHYQQNTEADNTDEKKEIEKGKDIKKYNYYVT